MSSFPSAEALRSALQEHVIAPWFPRSLDPLHGGFLCDFDHRWQPCGPHDKLLEFQARQTWFVAEALQLLPDDARLRPALEQGFAQLRAQWDSDRGGWFHRLDRAGIPQDGGAKHLHGMAYAIEACVAVFEATRDPRALRLAQQGFEWLDGHGHDDRYGGYLGFFDRAGHPIAEVGDGGWQQPVDPIGTALGGKDLNLHSDLLEAFTRLHAVWNDARVLARLRELAALIQSHLLPAGRGMFFYVRRDWQPLPQLMRYAYAFQTGQRLLEARTLLEDPAAVIRFVRDMVDATLPVAWDGRRGGICCAGVSQAPWGMDGQAFQMPAKPWWGQFELLKVLLNLDALVPSDGEYRDRFAAQWRYLSAHVFDARHGGTYHQGIDRLRWRHRLLGDRFANHPTLHKGSAWKDASHEGIALLYCLRTLPV